MSTITKAVLACGGWSTRFLPTTKFIAKQLVPILDRPQIMWILEECLNAGINEICIVHRDKENSIQAFFAPNPDLDSYLNSNNKRQYMEQYNSIMSQIKKLEFLPQTDAFPYGNGSPILVAQNFINNQPFVYMYADDFISEPKSGTFLNQMIDIFSKYNPDAVFGSQEVPIETINKYSSVKFNSQNTIPNTIESVIEKPNPQDAPSNITIFGRFVFTPKIISILKNTSISKGELWLTDAINNLAKTNMVIAAPTEKPISWITTGDPLNWLKANITMALKDPDMGPKISEFIKDLK